MNRSILNGLIPGGDEIFNVTDEFVTMIDGGDAKAADCSAAVLTMGQSYKAVHGYIALLICVFGTVANILNLIVLKEMSSPINRMLTALAFADMLVMVEYIPFAIHMYVIPTQNFSYSWALFVLFHAHFTQIFHTISIQITLTMAVWRVVAIRFSTASATYCTFKRCNYCILASYICPFILCLPNYFTFAIYYKQSFSLDAPYGGFVDIKTASVKKPFLEICGFLKDPECVKAIRQLDYYVVDLSEMAKARGGLLQDVNFWMYSVIIKLIPCVVLTVFMYYLLKTLYKAKIRHKELQAKSGLRMQPAKAEIKQSQTQPLITSGADLPVTENGQVKDHDKEALGEGEVNKPSGDKAAFHPSSPPAAGLKSNRPSQKHARGSRRGDRTSKMLVAVLFLFLLTEFPQGIMAFLSGLYGQEFFRYCYNTWAEVWDILALFNSAVNFVLYCFMSKQFRMHFQEIFKLSWRKPCHTTPVRAIV